MRTASPPAMTGSSRSDASGVLGYGYYGAFRARTAYDWTVEDSVYVREDVRGQGVGKDIVADLVRRAEARGFRQMLALIGDSENIGSIGVHASLGFHPRAGVLRATGVKVWPVARCGDHATPAWKG